VRVAPSARLRIASALARAILRGEYKPGERIPGEVELCRTYEASRPAIREALKTLAAKGLIESRKRDGTRVCHRDAWQMLDSQMLAWRLSLAPETKFVSDLLHMRAAIEPAAAAAAALNRSEATLRDIRTAFADMVSASHDAALFAEPDLRFHKAILAATGNELMVAFGSLIEAALYAFLQISSRHAGAPAPSIPLHEAVLAAIDRRDAEGAQAAMMALLDHTSRNVARNVEHGPS
jgi:DNA-binding FadR family transcriptional regulator